VGHLCGVPSAVAFTHIFPYIEAAQKLPGVAEPLAQLELEPFHDASMPQMFFDDLVYIGFIHVGVPDTLGIDYETRALVASVQATRLIDADLAGAGHGKFGDTLLGVAAQLRGAFIVAADAAIALIAAKEEVSGVVGHPISAQP
jgi:hypothetical protein